MEAYTLDSLLRRTQVIDQFESFIWTERFSDAGDFELKLKSNLQNRSLLSPGVLLAMNNSMRVMKVETVEDSTDSDGRKMLDVKGFSIEEILNDRVAKYSLSDTTTEPKWLIDDTPGNVARTMFDHICRDTALDPADAIPYLMPGTIFPADTMDEPAAVIHWEQEPDNLFTAIKNVCDQYDLGFRLVRNFDNSQLYFDIYPGNDRTTRQNILPAVIFSPGFDNLQNTKEFNSTQGSKNVAYVFSPAGFQVVYGDGVDPDVAGFERRVLVVNASDINADSLPSVTAALTQKGTEELNKLRAQAIFDGELDQNSAFVYGVDYQLGDVVEMRNLDGVITYKRVTEQIFVHDNEGERSYPTLSTDLFVAANTWISFTSSKAWIDYDSEATTWADM